MASQNLVSATISPEAQDAILKSIADIRSRLGFLLNLQASEVTGMFKAGKELVPFLAESRKVARNHPEILSSWFNTQEYERDCQLAEDLARIVDDVNELSEALGHTLTAARSDALVSSLDVYACARLNRDKLPGMNSVADTLGVYFKRSPHTAAKKAV